MIHPNSDMSGPTVATRREPKTISIGDVVAIAKDNKSSWKTDDMEYLGYAQKKPFAPSSETLQQKRPRLIAYHSNPTPFAQCKKCNHSLWILANTLFGN